MNHRLYLRVGDRVLHHANETWGVGRVVQVMTSIVPGGTALVRIAFEDGRERTFGNDLDSDTCCYFFGVRRVWEPGFDGLRRPEDRTRRVARRLLDR